MKWFYLMMSYIVKKFAGGMARNPLEDFKELIKENAVKIFLAITIASTLGSFFVVGFCTTLYQMVIHYQMGEALRMTPVTQVGLTMIIFSVMLFLIAYYYATKHERELKKSQSKHESHHQINSLHEALLLLVKDYISEREHQRQRNDEFRFQNNNQNNEAEKNSSEFKSSEEYKRH